MGRSGGHSGAAAAGTLLPARPNLGRSRPGAAESRSRPAEDGDWLASASRLEQIRAVGCHLLFRYGYSGMTMREIAARLRIKAASLYYHFPNKQAILSDLMTATAMKLMDGLLERIEPVEEPEAQLDAALRWHVLFHTQYIEAAFVSHSEMRSLEPHNLKVILKLRRDYDRLFDGILKRGIRKGVFQVEEPSVVRNCILTLCTATAGWFNPEGPLSAEQVAAQISRFVRAALVKGEPLAPSLDTARESRAAPVPHQ